MIQEVNPKRWGSDLFWNRIALVSGVMALLICVLLIANYIQIKKSDPVNMTVINSLVDRLYQNPADSTLRKDIRTLDLLSRKAYFTSQWQIRSGGYMILIALAILVISMQVVEYRKRINPVPANAPEDETMLQRQKARKWIILGGSAILVLSVVFAFLSSNDLEKRFKSSVHPEMGSTPASPAAKTDNPSDSATITSSDSIPVNAEKADTSSKTTPLVNNDNFPNFRGTGGTGVTSKKNIPVSWDGAKGTHILWKTAIPMPGYSSPVIWDDKILVTGANPPKQMVYCLDRNKGKILWSVPVGNGSKKPKVNNETGYSAPTPVVNEKGVFVIFPTGDIAGIDLNGKKLWEKDLGLPKNHYGHSSSLMLFKDNVIVQYDQTGSPKVMALSVKNGEVVWSTNRPVKVSWSSPILVNTGHRTELIMVAEPYVASYNPANGAELWKIDCITGEVGPSLTYANGIVFSVNDYSKLSAIKAGDQPSILWENNDYLSDIPSPVANDKYLFLATSYGTVVCYDAQKGEKYWEQDFGNSIFSSPMLVEGKVYVLDRTGVMHIFKADKEFKLVGEPKLGEKAACTPAFTNGRIYIRGEKNLYCIGE